VVHRVLSEMAGPVRTIDYGSFHHLQVNRSVGRRFSNICCKKNTPIFRGGEMPLTVSALA